MEIKKRAVILYGHPYEESYSNATKEAVIEGFIQGDNKNYKVIDLFDDKFNPIGDIEKSTAFRSKLAIYKSLLNEAETIVILSPIWWSGLPAIMKSFLDHVFPNGSIKFKKLKKAFVYTTSATPNSIIKLVLKSPVKHSLKATFKNMGIHKMLFRNLDKIKISEQRREKFLEKIIKDVKHA